MDKKIIEFADTEIEEYKFHQNKNPILINDIDIDKLIVSNKLLFGKQDFEYFIGYKDSEKIRPLCIFCPQMIIHKRNFDENRQIYLFIEKEKGFVKYMKILEKVRNIIKNKFNRELIYSKNYLKAEKKNTKGGFQCLYAPVILMSQIIEKMKTITLRCF